MSNTSPVALPAPNLIATSSISLHSSFLFSKCGSPTKNKTTTKNEFTESVKALLIQLKTQCSECKIKLVRKREEFFKMKEKKTNPQSL